MTDEAMVHGDSHDLGRFLDAQEGVYPQALGELRNGSKKSHWMWYIFPQLRSLGTSEKAVRFGIASLEEARAYLEHPVLGPRLLECCTALLEVDGLSALEILGPPDDMKLRSSATLFSLVSPAGSPFHALLDKFFGGCPDPATLELVGQV